MLNLPGGKKVIAAIAIIFATPAVAGAEAAATLATSDKPAPPVPHQLAYLELLGKGGMWGVGYEWRTRRFSVGGVGSYYMLGGDRYMTLSPYVGFVPASGDHVSWFMHLGPQLVHRSTPSPGPEWQGMTTTGFAVELSSGVEYRFTQLSVRGYALASYGSHFAPGIGANIGWSW
jgi:hypothetical protein